MVVAIVGDPKRFDTAQLRNALPKVAGRGEAKGFTEMVEEEL